MKIAPKSFVKFVQEGVNTVKIDDLNKSLSNCNGYLEFPNGQRANNMLDAFIQATGTVVHEYNPEKVVDFLA